MPGIDFLIIGAQKAGTTSLFEYIKRHPQIHMPAEKEIAFFNVERIYRRGEDWYLSQVLRNVSPGTICGEASVGYMRGTPYGDLRADALNDLILERRYKDSLEEVIPHRIKEMLPDVRLICVLRDPVARAHSQYRMEVLNKAESRTFDEAVDQLMEPDALAHARIMPTSTNSYVVSGEYFRILSPFLKLFGREHLMAIFSDDLIDRPGEILATVFEFVGVASDYLPDNLDTRYRAAATTRRIHGLDLYAWQRYIARARAIRFMWHALPGPVREMIDSFYRTASFRVAMWNARRGETEDAVSQAARMKLAAHYGPDSEALTELLGVEVPWLMAWDR